jgi:hypothetical protein
MRRLHRRDRIAVAETRKECINGSDIDVRHGRQRSGRCSDSVDECDAGQLQPVESDDKSTGSKSGSEPDRKWIPVNVLWRDREFVGDDDIHSRRQQHLWAVHEVDSMHDRPWSEGASGVQCDPD